MNLTIASSLIRDTGRHAGSLPGELGSLVRSGWVGKGRRPLSGLHGCVWLLRLGRNGVIPWSGPVPPSGQALQLLPVPQACGLPPAPSAWGPGADRLDCSLRRLA